MHYTAACNIFCTHHLQDPRPLDEEALFTDSPIWKSLEKQLETTTIISEYIFDSGLTPSISRSTVAALLEEALTVSSLSNARDHAHYQSFPNRKIIDLKHNCPAKPQPSLQIHSLFQNIDVTIFVSFEMRGGTLAKLVPTGYLSHSLQVFEISHFWNYCIFLPQGFRGYTEPRKDAWNCWLIDKLTLDRSNWKSFRQNLFPFIREIWWMITSPKKHLETIASREGS